MEMKQFCNKDVLNSKSSGIGDPAGTRSPHSQDSSAFMNGPVESFGTSPESVPPSRREHEDLCLLEEAEACSLPVQNLFPRPEENMLLLLQVSKGLLEVLDPMRHSADVRVDRNRHDSGAVRSFSVERLELILGSAKKFLRFMVLENHHRDVVQLYRIRERNERAMRRFDLVGLIIVDPVGDIVKAGFGQEIESLFSFCEPWTKPS